MIQEVCVAMAEDAPLPQGGLGRAFDDLISGSATPAQAGAFLYALRNRTLTGEDLATCASVLLSHARTITIPGSDRAVDTCGTGGDHSMTFNISTAAAFVAAGAGVPVIKHGNRAQTSRSGSADLLTALGVSIDASEERVIRTFQEANIAFLSAPMYHPALKTLAGVRSELGFRTILNISGPLCNPAGPINRIIGVADPALLGPMAEALQALGVKKALVVSGDQLDELSLTGENRICELSSGQIDHYTLSAADLGLAEAPRELLVAENPAESAAIISRVLHGGEGPARDIVLLNAAGAILAGEGATTFSSALKMAEDSIDSGRALESLGLLVEITGGN